MVVHSYDDWLMLVFLSHFIAGYVHTDVPLVASATRLFLGLKVKYALCFGCNYQGAFTFESTLFVRYFVCGVCFCNCCISVYFLNVMYCMTCCTSCIIGSVGCICLSGFVRMHFLPTHFCVSEDLI